MGESAAQSLTGGNGARPQSVGPQARTLYVPPYRARHALLAAARPDRIAAAASFHGGGLVTDTAQSPHLVLPQVKARLYFGHGVNDQVFAEIKFI